MTSSFSSSMTAATTCANGEACSTGPTRRSGSSTVRGDSDGIWMKIRSSSRRTGKGFRCAACGFTPWPVRASNSHSCAAHLSVSWLRTPWESGFARWGHRSSYANSSPSTLHSTTSTPPRLTPRTSPSHRSSSVPAYRHTAGGVSAALDCEDVAITQPCLCDGVSRLEDLAGFVAYCDGSLSLWRQAPGHQLAPELGHRAFIRCDDDAPHEVVARVAEQVDAHRGRLTPSGWGRGAMDPDRGADPCRSPPAPSAPSTPADR